MNEKVISWTGGEWTIKGRRPLKVGDLEYAQVDGSRVVTAITVDGIKLQRTFSAEVSEMPVRIIWSEAQSQGWENPCLQASLSEINRVIKKREARELRRRSTRSSFTEDSPLAISLPKELAAQDSDHSDENPVKE